MEDSGTGPVVVALHGLTATRRYVFHGSRHLLKRGYRVVAYDARGHGDSEAPTDSSAYAYRALVGDLERVLDERAIRRPILVGSSMGAHTATAFALERPERVAALVLITPSYAGSPRASGAELDEWDRIAAALGRGDIEAFLAASRTDELPPRWRDHVATAIRQRLERHRDLEAVAAAVRVVARSSPWQGLERLESLHVPALVVGSRDEIDPRHPLAVAERYARLLPRGELAVEEAGSPPLAWQGAQLSRRTGDFLERVL